MELTYPRFIHAQMLTHRMFSRNASSSRAIPIAKGIDAVRASPALPVFWGSNKAGMQAGEELEGFERDAAESEWRKAAVEASNRAYWMETYGLHKQISNRVMEPFLHIKVIVSATEYTNFFKLRIDDAAQPEIALLAQRMKQAMGESVPEALEVGEWHTPYVEWDEFTMSQFRSREDLLDTKLKCSVARCARVSYLTHDNLTPDVKKDIALADRLLEDDHMSPFEHCCTPMKQGQWSEGQTHIHKDGSRWSSNLREWVMYRNLLC